MSEHGHRHETVTYTIDADDRLVHVNDAWNRFAIDNDAPELTREHVLGRLLWDFIAGLSTRSIYAALVARAREGRRLSYGYRCDAVEFTRTMRMTVGAGAGWHVRFESSVTGEEPLAHGQVWDRQARRSGELLRACSWCKRVETASGWSEVDEAVDALGLFMHGQIPHLTHGMCPTCHDAVTLLLDTRETP